MFFESSHASHSSFSHPLQRRLPLPAYVHALRRTSPILAGLLGLTAALADGFQTGNLVVLQLGDGSAALTSAATPVSLLEYDTGGQLRQTLSIPSGGLSGSRLTAAGSSTSEGYLSLSADQLSLSVAGYDAPAGTASVASTTAVAANRVVDSVSALGVISRFASSASLLSGQNIRSAVTAGTDAWAVGSSGGTVLMTGGNPGSVYNAITTLRVANILNGDLMFSTQSGTSSRGIYQFNGLPLTASTPVQLIPMDSSARPVDFALSADVSVAYVADERTTGGGVQKWTQTGGVWSLSYTLNAGSGRGARGLAVDFSGLNPAVYATTTQNELIKIVDTGGASIPAVLAAAPANVEWRGLEFAPIPEPAETAIATGVAVLGWAGWYRRQRIVAGQKCTRRPASSWASRVAFGGIRRRLIE